MKRILRKIGNRFFAYPKWMLRLRETDKRKREKNCILFILHLCAQPFPEAK
ncbi:hypothetical protein [Prevotella sp. HUN102]|uniref:hypothetical protein n=1 Tax=Prevotella sp. HUN102 TaxID=1392486 RepID=UPI000B0650DE|nr:hypothetical protein [Prevotella sp. HUN102]